MSDRRLVPVLVATAALTAGLLAAPAASAEEDVTLTGRLVLAHEDDFEHQRSRHSFGLETPDGAHTQLRFRDEERAHQLSSREVRIRGERRGDVVEVLAAEGTGSDSTTASTGGHGPMKLAVVPFSFADRDLVPTTQQLGELVFQNSSTTPTARIAFDQHSYGTLPVEGQVFPTVSISASFEDACDYRAWGAAAREAANVDDTFTHVAHVMPQATNCSFGGIAEFPGRYSWTVNKGITDEEGEYRFRGTLVHELGHNLNSHHGGAYRCTDRKGNPITLGGSCSLGEYGDPFTVMGESWGERHFNAYQKGTVSAHATSEQRSPWFSSDGDTTEVTTGGEYVLSSLESAGGPQVLRIPKPGSRTDFYYVELRDGTGIDAPLRPLTRDGVTYTNDAPLGVTVRIAPGYDTATVSKLLDMTPGSPYGFRDAELPEGASFTDPKGLVIEHLGPNDGDLATVVRVRFPTKGGK